MNDLLNRSKEELANPLKDARRKLLIILNVLYIILLIIFVSSEKIATGNFVPDPVLYFVYIPAFFLNLISAIYNIKVFRYNKNEDQHSINNNLINSFINQNHKRIDLVIGWLSIVPIMLMSFCNMAGLGNPSNDAIFTDYSLAQSLIIGAVIIIGRNGAIVWFVIVVSVLFWDVTRLGWDYEYHYLTPSEVTVYKDALRNNDSHALLRKAELEKYGLNPPKVTRYFNTWIVFIIVAFMAAYYFSGITIDIMKVIPKVILDIERVTEDRKRLDLELEAKQNENTKSAMRIVRYSEILEELNTEIEKLDHGDKRKLAKVIGIIRQSLNKETDWEKFQTSFDSIHSDFFKTLKEKYSFLTQGEMKHLAYIRMNLSSAEISRLMEVKIESLRTLRHRLKKRLNINEDIDLRDFVDNIEIID